MRKMRGYSLANSFFEVYYVIKNRVLKSKIREK